MLKYLIIQLDDTSVSYCHYNNDNTERRLIDYNTLKEAILWSMKENLTVQFVFPDYELPQEYKSLISGIDHSSFVSSRCVDSKLRETAEVIVFNSWENISGYPLSTSQIYVVRTKVHEMLDNVTTLISILPKVTRLNLVITDTENFDTQSQTRYAEYLDMLSKDVSELYLGNNPVQINILTDRMLLDDMNNCGAGHESITLAPDGKFYICPGFFLDGSDNIGNLIDGVNIRNGHLFQIEYAPICRACDAWHCRRCVWQNKKFTLEVNTPSREQCVMVHIERNCTKDLLAMIRESSVFLPGKEIPELSYLDPFDEVIKPK